MRNPSSQVFSTGLITSLNSLLTFPVKETYTVVPLPSSALQPAVNRLFDFYDLVSKFP